jgi:hypothetical protein
MQDISVFTEGQMILRLDHSFEIGEDPVYSKPVTLDLSKLFVDIVLEDCTEMTVTANSPVCIVKCSVLSQYRSLQASIA